MAQFTLTTPSSETKIVFQSHLYKIRSNDHSKLDPFLLLALLSAPIVKKQIRSKQFTQDIIDTLGRRIMELELPFPKKEDERKKIIERVKLVFQKRSEAKDIMRSVLLDTVPLDDSRLYTKLCFDGTNSLQLLRKIVSIHRKLYRLQYFLFYTYVQSLCRSGREVGIVSFMNTAESLITAEF